MPIMLLTNATRSPLSLRVLSPLPHLRSGDNEPFLPWQWGLNGLACEKFNADPDTQ